MNLYSRQRRILGGLLVWGSGSVVVGAGAARSADPYIRHVGLQAMCWGSVDLLLAVWGRRGTRVKEHRLPTLGVAAVERDRRSLLRLLLVNIGLDACYVVVGSGLRRAARNDPARRGDGVGIIIQGLFLLGYDLVFALLVQALPPVEEPPHPTP